MQINKKKQPYIWQFTDTAVTNYFSHVKWICETNIIWSITVHLPNDPLSSFNELNLERERINQHIW